MKEYYRVALVIAILALMDGFNFAVPHNTGYWSLTKDEDEITITGGEPTTHEEFFDIARLAVSSFKKVHLCTVNPLTLKSLLVEDLFTTVNFGIHTRLKDCHEVKIGIPVYAHTMLKRYTLVLPTLLSIMGFSGLTIEEDKRSNEKFTGEVLTIPGFSIRINDNKACLYNLFIMPDMTIEHDFTPHL